MDSRAAGIHEKIRSFKKKYYLDMFVRGLILSLSILIVYFLLASLLEYNLWLGPWARFLVFFSFFAIAAYCVLRFLREPLQWYVANKGLTEEQSARLIGNYLPAVKDRLLNFVQLESSQNSLAVASILQKSREFEPLSFESVIDVKQNKKYIKYLLLPVAAALAIFLFNRSILTGSAERIIFFTREYSPAAPFTFNVDAKTLTGFYDEDLTLRLELAGQAIPDNAYLVIKDQRIKLQRAGNGQFHYTFEKLQNPLEFQVEAAGFFSNAYKVELYNRPELNQLKISLIYPRYLQRQNQELVNVGNLEIPEGTKVNWKLKTIHTNNILFQFSGDSLLSKTEPIDNQWFGIDREFRNPESYEVILENKYSRNKERISYNVEVVKDQHPSITVNNLRDSVLYKRILLGGTIGDDHGISELVLHFKVRDPQGKDKVKHATTLPVTRGQAQQNFFFNWSVDSLSLQPGDQLEYYLQVWDNDGVNGRKSTKSSSYSFLLPSKEDLMVNIKTSQSKTEEKIDQSVGKAQKLQEQIEQATQKLKGKQSLSWQDKKMLEDIVDQKKLLDQMINEVKEQNKLLEEKKDAFTEQDQRIKEKAEQIQKLMDELLDEETKRLFEELQKLLKENTDVNDLKKILDKLNQNSDNLEKELERTLELFKDLQYEFKFDQALKNLSKDIEKQESILERTRQLEEKSKDKNSKTKSDQKKKDNKQTNEKSPEGEDSKGEESEQSNTDLAKEQEQLMKNVQENQEKMKELQKLGEELHKPDALPSDEDTQEVLEEQEESMEQLNQNEPSKAKTPQENSLQKMNEMKQQMESAQSSSSMEMDMENLESLRQIIHGLVKLSYDQESLLKQFGDLSQNDPKFNTLAQNQIKLKDDSKVIEDSLLALGKRDPFMGSFVTKEIGELKSHMDKVIEANKERRRPQASTEMQSTMTSINNLALMLDDHFEMMMQMMANAKGKMGKSGKKQKGQRPQLSEMQQQLNEKINQLKNSGKSGQQLSEELAELAAEQERIRKALQEMQEKMMDGQSTTPGDQIPGKMEQTEMDLVNKQLTDQLIRRQQEILTRLLETEKSMREQDLDEERKGETAKEYDKEIPKAFEEYLRLKEKEVELLKTVPPKLYPYYKKEVSEYFKRMGN